METGIMISKLLMAGCVFLRCGQLEATLFSHPGKFVYNSLETGHFDDKFCSNLFMIQLLLTFPQYILVILKRKLQNYQNILKKCILITTWMTIINRLKSSITHWCITHSERVNQTQLTKKILHSTDCGCNITPRLIMLIK